ncbi:MAG: hypothetical protein PUD75_01375 [Prevotella sp.]|nr:hypothetical protein [Prevotella sp.]
MRILSSIGCNHRVAHQPSPSPKDDVPLCQLQAIRENRPLALLTGTGHEKKADEHEVYNREDTILKI